MFCKNCYESLVFEDSQLKCPSCHKVWNEVLLDYTNDIIGEKYNSLIAYEYYKLQNLINNRQVYGIVFQIKDIYEVLIKFPVLLGASYLYHQKDRSEEENNLLVTLINQKNSMGHWSEHLRKIQTIFSKKEGLDSFKEVVRKTNDFVNRNGVVSWRNMNVGHGATKGFEDEDLYDDISERIGKITEYLLGTNSSYSKIHICALDNNKTSHPLLGYKNIDVDNGDSLVAITDGTTIELEPFFYLVNGGIYFYDNYIIKKSYLDIVEYPHGKRDIKATNVFDEFKTTYEMNSNINDSLLSKAEIEISNNVLNIKDFVKPDFIYDWIKKQIEDNEKIFVLQLEKGMGKSTLVRALDPFQMNSVKLPNVMVRTYYINPTYGSKIYTFRSELGNKFAKDDDNNEYIGDTPQLYEDGDDPRINLANFLNRAHESAIFAGKELLLIIDGLDELNSQRNRNISDFIPEPEMLNDGVHILLTSRTLLDSDNVTYFTQGVLERFKNCPHLEVHMTDESYCEVKYKYLKNQIIDELGNICKGKKCKFVVTEEELVEFSENIKDENFLFLRQLKELALIKLNHLLEQGCKEIDAKDLLYTDRSSLLDEYFSSLKKNYGEKYYNQFIRIMTTMALVDDYLTIEDLAYLVVNGNITFAFIGFINTIRMFLTVRRTNIGNSYLISHVENKEYIRTHMKNELIERGEELFNKIKFILDNKDVEYDDRFDMTIMPYFINIARTFNRCNRVLEYDECIKIFDGLYNRNKIFTVGDNIDDLLVERNIKYYQSFLFYANKRKNLNCKEDALPFIRALFQIACFRFIQRDSKNCLDDFQKAYKKLSEFDLSLDEMHEFYVAPEPVFIFLLAEKKNFAKSWEYIEWYEKVFSKLVENNYPLTPRDRAFHEYIYSYYYVVKKQYDKALEYSKKIIEILKPHQETPFDKWIYAEQLSDHGKILTLSGMHIEAIEVFKEVAALYEECVAEGYNKSNKVVYYNWSRLSKAYLGLKDIDNSINAMKEGIIVLEEAEKTNTLSNRVFIIRAYYDLCKIYYEIGDYENCAKYLEMSRQKYDQLDTFQKEKRGAINVYKMMTEMAGKLKERRTVNE